MNNQTIAEFEDVKNLIRGHLKDAHVEIYDMTGTKDHLDILVVSDEFIGKMIFEQHKILMNILSERLKTDIHAVQLKTMTKESAKTKGIKC
jgi:stress-induced morphogen